MKSRNSLIRLKRFQVEEKRKRVAQIEMMIADFDRMAVDLDREIASEEQKSGISDPNHFAYSTYARSARQRRDNLRTSAENLVIQLDEAKASLGEAFEELKKAEILEDRERGADKLSDAIKETVAISERTARMARINL
ncbi:flagellar export protein FliJ [Microvirga sp. W0021]|uniref:Flagellar export protein FliJ n=1 Tax=Hohaiivirga grylli TaxID=3133970 RepID=A0ABV0BGC3_9HYPH